MAIPMLATTTMRDLWDTARCLDPTTRVTPQHRSALERKFVGSMPYTRDTMFRKMARREIGIYRDVPVLVRSQRGTSTRSALIDALSRRFSPRETSRVQVGPKHELTRLRVREIMRRWLGGRAIIGVTDLHIRNKRVEEVIDTQALSYFNTLILGSAKLATQEMMTLVIASPGNVTDSHSDDPDGTNHCFFGKKLWLAWDVFEGMAAGLEDVERQEVFAEARFDMTRFLSLASSRWFVVSTGDTLFLPGNLTHKVLTLEPYLGVGSFNIGLPSSLDTFTRWIHHGPLWSIDDRRRDSAGLVDEAARVTLSIAERARGGSRRLRDRFGYEWMRESHRVWMRNTAPDVREHVMRHETFARLVGIAKLGQTVQ